MPALLLGHMLHRAAVAGLAAEGESRLSPLETVERGYGQLVERLKSLGAQVEQVEQRMSQQPV